MKTERHHDATAVVFAIPTIVGGRSHPLFDGYIGQFHIPGESDWDACFTFDGGKLNLGEDVGCQIWFSENLIKHAKHKLRSGFIFHIREGVRTVGIGRIIDFPVSA